MNKTIIPVMHCFNDRYSMPASVAFLSMLEHANSQYFYKLYVLHTDISVEHQKMLLSIVKEFTNASLEFINMDNRFADLFEGLTEKGHFSKEMFYKFCPASLFPNYDKIMIADVDVVYQGDISQEFINFDVASDYYLAGHRGVFIKDTWLEEFYKNYDKKYSSKEKEKIYVNACYWIFNLKKMRADNMEQKFVEFASKNVARLIQPEQDTINLVCAPKVKLLPINTVVCTYLYDLLENPLNANKDIYYSKEELIGSFKNPIQIHYSTSTKPWNCSTSTMSKLWFQYLFKTPFAWEYIEQNEHKSLWNNILFFKNKTVVKFLSKGRNVYKFLYTKMKRIKSPAPLISVLCCSYNHEKYIAQAIEGIINQKTDFPMEIIISDDASTDKTQEIILSYAQKYPKIIKLTLRKENVGVGTNYYEALKKVSGKYLAICDGDDCWLDMNKLQKQVSFLEKHPDYSLCCSDVLWHYVSENKKNTVFNVRSYMPAKMRKKKYFSFDDLLNCRFISSSTCVLRWSMKNNIPLWLKRHCVIDFPLTLIHSMLGKIKVFEEVFALYNIHEKGVSRQDQSYLYRKKMDDILNYVDEYTDGYKHKEIKNFLERYGVK